MQTSTNSLDDSTCRLARANVNLGLEDRQGEPRRASIVNSRSRHDHRRHRGDRAHGRLEGARTRHDMAIDDDRACSLGAGRADMGRWLVVAGAGIDMTKLIVDGKEIDVPPEYTLLQACEAAGAEIPRFCFHERLSIAGNCRMCLVELVGSPKPVASCAWGVRDCRPGPKGEPPEINTKTPMVKKAREGRDGVPADQPSARLPDLRPGRRMRPAGPGDGLRRRRQPLPGEQARGRGQVYRPAGQDDHEPLHPLHALRPLRRPRSRACPSSAPSAAARTWRSPPISSRR